jgi:hypothetical protein
VPADRIGAGDRADGAACGRGFGIGLALGGGAAALAKRVRRWGDERRPQAWAMCGPVV